MTCLYINQLTVTAETTWNYSKLVKMIENLWGHSIRDFRTRSIEGLIMLVQGSNESKNALENWVPVKTDQP